jgi:hypothetical protein
VAPASFNKTHATAVFFLRGIVQTALAGESGNVLSTHRVSTSVF